MNHPQISDRDLITQLEKATENLSWISETDRSWQVFLWEERSEITPEKIILQLGLNLDTTIEVCELDDFFAIATQEQDWHNQEESQEVKRYQQLVQILKVNLRNIQVYRLGKTTIDVYVIGQTEAGNLAGLFTQIVET
jgi:hypothetical protein